jgi:hypothetical protein
MNSKLFQKFNSLTESCSIENDEEKLSFDEILNMSSSKLGSTTFKIDREENEV